MALTVKAAFSTPMLHVPDIERSLRFYALLGFELVDMEGDPGSIGWARVHCEGGAIMFLRSDEPKGPHKDRFLLYMYAPDLPALRTQIADAGVDVPAIAYPGHMRSGELSLKDPDGYTILIGHWGKQEHDAWEQQRTKRLNMKPR